MSNGASGRSGGIGFLGLLTIVFIVLKLTDYIDWSWWWVLAPILIPWAIILTLILVVGILSLIVKWLETDDVRARRRVAEALRNYGDKLK